MTPNPSAFLPGKLVCALLFLFSLLPGLASAAVGSADRLENANCLTCHDGKKEKPETENADGEKRLLRPVEPALFGKGVHARMQCVDCHKGIVDNKAPHARTSEPTRPDCAECHAELWTQTQIEGKTAERPRLGVVVDNIAAYRNSFHARVNADDETRPNTTCNECHDVHEFNVPPRGEPGHNEWHLATPEICGNCHDIQLEEYAESVHGKAVMENGDMDAATCVSCHTVHAIGATAVSPVRLDITDRCGDCHKENLKTYRGTYHGKVGALGYAYTAKCFDCHGSHDVRASDDPDSMTHRDNRLETCQKCHDDRKPGMRTATAGFVTFEPHAHSGDFERYPEMWIVTKFMIALLIGVFLFFWSHSLLWYYREWKEGKSGKTTTWVLPPEPPAIEGKFVRRFPLGWRIAHLTFALVTMMLVLTGTTALFAESAWAPAVAQFFGGPQTLGLIHRVAATLFIGIFFIHFVYVMQSLLRDRNFKWFGPDSLLPNWKDLRDCYGMFRWFFGKGPKPQFERWTYFEKFDYWAVFWGVSIIGTSGLMLAFPHITATYLPGWVFNVATVVHGEEAFLAAVFLFTVHFFNNHFRPEKMPPPDIVMFTGAQSLEDFRNDHPAQYQRLVESGQLDKYLVDAPSATMTRASKVLGIALILTGLILLALVVNGFLATM